MSDSFEIQQLVYVEKLKVKNTYTDNNYKYVHIISCDGREYIIFKNDTYALKYAIKVFIETQDDPAIITQLRWVGKTIEQYAEEIISVNNIHEILSYDKHHKVLLNNNAIAYRIM